MYELLLKRKAEKSIARLPATVHERVIRTIDGLAEDPRPRGCSKLQGSEDWRVRVGDYRIIYGIDDEQHIVEVLNVAHRREIYR